jgi:hypothetical protein
MKFEQIKNAVVTRYVKEYGDGFISCQITAFLEATTDHNELIEVLYYYNGMEWSEAVNFIFESITHK